MAKSRFSSEGGFSLIETMVATMLLVVGIVATAQMFVLATTGNLSAQRGTYTAALAQEKMEQLRGMTWGYDEIGLPVTDFATNIAKSPPTDDGVGLSPSPPNTLSANVDGYVDFLDRFGNSIGTGAATPANAVYVRRWSVEPLPTNPNNTLVLQVLVFVPHDRQDNGNGAVLDRRKDEARLVSVKSRKSR